MIKHPTLNPPLLLLVACMLILPHCAAPSVRMNIKDKKLREQQLALNRDNHRPEYPSDKRIWTPCINIWQLSLGATQEVKLKNEIIAFWADDIIIEP